MSHCRPWILAAGLCLAWLPPTDPHITAEDIPRTTHSFEAPGRWMQKHLGGR